jgi:hypothetical protein
MFGSGPDFGARNSNFCGSNWWINFGSNFRAKLDRGQVGIGSLIVLPIPVILYIICNEFILSLIFKWNFAYNTWIFANCPKTVISIS